VFNNQTPIRFSWLATAGAASYRVEFAADSLFNSILHVEDPVPLNRLYVDYTPTQPGALFWRVRGLNGCGAGTWPLSRNVWKVFLLTVPGPVPLTAPADFSFYASGQPRWYSWMREQRGTTTFRIEWTSVATGHMFFQNTTSTMAQQTLSPGVSDGLDWHWRVQATNLAGTGPWSDVRTVTLITSVPPQVTLDIPLNLTGICSGIGREYVWHGVDRPEPITYLVQWSLDPTFATFPFYYKAGHNLSCFETITGAPGSHWFWRVVPSNDFGTGTPSEARELIMTDPAQPLTLLGPPDQTGICPDMDQLFTWTAFCAFDAFYWVQWSQDPEFHGATPVAFIDPWATQHFPGPAGEVWYWHVRAEHQGHQEPWSDTRSFVIVSEAIDQVELLEPPHASPVGDGLPVRYVWTESHTPGVVYDIEWSSREDFADPITATSTEAFVVQSLTGHLGTWYWHVRPRTTCSAADWSNPFKVTVVPVPVPQPVVLIAPERSAEIGAGIPVQYSWRPSEYAANYRIQWDLSDAFPTPQEALISALDASVWKVLTTPLGPWYWRVRAENNQGQSAWSETYKMTLVNPPVPGPVTLAAPENGIEIPANQAVDFSVYREYWAGTYTIQWDHEGLEFNPPAYEAQFTASDSSVAHSFAPGNWIWRARAENQTGHGEWSNKQSFKSVPPQFIMTAPQPLRMAVARANKATCRISWPAVPCTKTYTVLLSRTDAGMTHTIRMTTPEPGLIQKVDTKDCWTWVVQAKSTSGRKTLIAGGEIQKQTGKVTPNNGLLTTTDVSALDGMEDVVEAPAGKIAAGPIVELPSAYHLYQNYPNPFNPETTIRFDLPEAVPVELTVFNTLGQEVAVLMSEVQPAGTYTVRWSGIGENGLSVPSGLYMYRLKAGSFTEVKKMLLVH
jgi:hypothetical protein